MSSDRHDGKVHPRSDGAGRRLRAVKLAAVCLCALGGILAGHGDFDGRPARAAAPAKPRFTSQPPRGIPKSLWSKLIPADNPMTPEKVALGESLFFDTRLSADGAVSCATCHDPASAFTDRNTLAVGAAGKTGTRNAPTILNAMFSASQFWDGRARTLEEQVEHPLSNPAEMGAQGGDDVAARLAALPEYRRGFRRAFGTEEITVGRVAKAIAAFERTQLSGNSPFDRFAAGDGRAITEAQKRGWELFKGKARCADCHKFTAASPFFTDFDFHNTGVGVRGKDFAALMRRVPAAAPADADGRRAAGTLAHAEGFSDLGRYLVTRREKDAGAFKTPTLRDVELTAPYMHDGSEKTLLDVVRFYSRGGEPNTHLDGKMKPLNLSDAEMNNLVEFMRALTSDDVLRQVQSVTPRARVASPPRGKDSIANRRRGK